MTLYIILLPNVGYNFAKFPTHTLSFDKATYDAVVFVPNELDIIIVLLSIKTNAQE